jgi:hypothetical protein
MSVDLIAREFNMTWREVFKLNVFSFFIKYDFLVTKNKKIQSNNKKARNVRR